MQRGSLVWLTIFTVVAVMFTMLPPMVAEQDSVARTYSTLVEVDALARKHFIQPIDDDRLVDGAIRGMMLRLDPYSGYLSAEELALHQQRQNGEYVGVGIELGMARGELTVIAPLDGGPAQRAGVAPGDVILAIDEHDARSMSVFDASERLTGRAGDVIRLRVRNRADGETRTVELARGEISMHTVVGLSRNDGGAWEYIVDEDAGVAYVRITRFAEHTYAEFTAALDSIRRRDARGLILDLRSNPGGLMQQAVAVLDRFIAEGVLVSTVTRRNAVHEFRATGADTLRDIRLVVLINGASASASEIVAGSLQDHRRATIVGQRSFGKGSVQQLIHLSEHGSAVKLTTAYYRLPSGRIIHRGLNSVEEDGWGVRPDVEVEAGTSEEADAPLAAALAILRDNAGN